MSSSLQQEIERLDAQARELERRVAGWPTRGESRPAFRLHPADRCAWCGAGALETELVEVVHRHTHEPAMRCRDDVACIRRMTEARRAA
jgi:hypothetical protein